MLRDAPKINYSVIQPQLRITDPGIIDVSHI